MYFSQNMSYDASKKINEGKWYVEIGMNTFDENV